MGFLFTSSDVTDVPYQQPSERQGCSWTWIAFRRGMQTDGGVSKSYVRLLRQKAKANVGSTRLSVGYDMTLQGFFKFGFHRAPRAIVQGYLEGGAYWESTL